jgi:hypothetical protein
MTSLLASLLPSLVVADVGSILKTVVGVVLALAGLAFLLMGIVTVADGTAKKGAILAVLGAGLIAVGLLMVGAI